MSNSRPFGAVQRHQADAGRPRRFPRFPSPGRRDRGSPPAFRNPPARAPVLSGSPAGRALPAICRPATCRCSRFRPAWWRGHDMAVAFAAVARQRAKPRNSSPTGPSRSALQPAARDQPRRGLRQRARASARAASCMARSAASPTPRRGHVDDPLERQIVGGLHHHAHIGDGVADLLRARRSAGRRPRDTACRA